MLSLDYLNQLKHIANGAIDGDGEGALIDMLEALLPALPPMVGMVVSEFLREYNSPKNPHITIEDIHGHPDY